MKTDEQLYREYPFIPSKYAKPKCSACHGSGLIRVHIALGSGRNRRVVPKANNIATKPCGCSTRKYLKLMQKLRQ